MSSCRHGMGVLGCCFPPANSMDHDGYREFGEYEGVSCYTARVAGKAFFYL